MLAQCCTRASKAIQVTFNVCAGTHLDGARVLSFYHHRLTNLLVGNRAGFCWESRPRF